MRGVILLVCLLVAVQAFAQQQASPAFDVATIKPVDPEARISRVGVGETPDGIDGENVTLRMLIGRAYGYMQFPLDEQVTGVPDWAKSQRYNVKAKMSEADALNFHTLTSAGREKRIQEMLQALLVERFKLVLHRETKTLPDFELVVAKGGAKVKAGSADDPDAVKDQDGHAIPGLIQFHDEAMFFQQNTMEQVANEFTNVLGRMVIDKTGMGGSYTFTLGWIPKGEPEKDDGPSLFTKLQELGLRLQPSKGEVPVLAIDHVEPPTAN